MKVTLIPILSEGGLPVSFHSLHRIPSGGIVCTFDRSPESESVFSSTLMDYSHSLGGWSLRTGPGRGGFSDWGQESEPSVTCLICPTLHTSEDGDPGAPPLPESFSCTWVSSTPSSSFGIVVSSTPSNPPLRVVREQTSRDSRACTYSSYTLERKG